jgi:hypothetical protein
MKSTIATATTSAVLAAKLPAYFRRDGCQRISPPIVTHFDGEREKHSRQVETPTLGDCVLMRSALLSACEVARAVRLADLKPIRRFEVTAFAAPYGLALGCKSTGSIFDISARLAARLLRVPLILPARGVTFVVSRAACLLRSSCALSCVLADIAGSPALLSLLCCQRYGWQSRKEYTSHQARE